MEKQIASILSQVAEIVQLDKKQKERRGTPFNIFQLLNLTEKETKHSAFIAELLNPKGSHGLGDTFLRAFIDTLDCLKEWDFDPSAAYVQTEKRVGYLNKSCTQGGNIDIWVKSHDKAIIIENKINATDRENQLFRYRNYAEKQFSKNKLSDYRLIYLTLYGDEASDNSTFGKLKEGEDYHAISYSSEILEWLKTCATKTFHDTAVSNAIAQYTDTVKKLTHQDMSAENIDKMVEIMARPENVEAVTLIGKHIGDWEYKIVEKYLISKLQEWANHNNLQFAEEILLNPGKKRNGFYFYRKEWTNSAIWIYTESKKWKDFYIYISSINGKSLRGLYDKPKLFRNKGNMYSPYGWEFLDKYRNWTYETMVDIAEGKVAEYIIERVKGVLEKIDEIGIEMP